MGGRRSRILAGLLVGAALVAVPAAWAAPKKCRQLCRTEIGACIDDAEAQIVCTGLRGHDKRSCRHDLRAAVKTCRAKRGPILQACATSSSTTTCSPSGAFLD